MPTLIKKRGKIRYRGTVVVAGVRKEKLFPDKSKKSFRAAAAWEKEKKKELEALVFRKTSFVLFGLWKSTYLNEYHQLVKNGRCSGKTLEEKKATFKRFSKEKAVKNDMPVNSITRSFCDKFLKKQFRKRSGNAANKDRKNLAHAWEWGRDYFELWPDVSNPFRINKFPENLNPRYIPSEADFWKVYENVNDLQDRVMLLTFIMTAARRSEVFRLKWSDIDFENDCLRLWTRKRFGGALEYDWLPMTKELCAGMAEWLKERFSTPTPNKSHIFVSLYKSPFCNQHYGRPFKYRQHFMKRLCKKAKVKPFGFHSIRHLTASILYHKGYDLAIIQAILRHKSPTTTNRYLKSLGLEHTRKALEKGLKKPAKVIQYPKKMPPEGQL